MAGGSRLRRQARGRDRLRRHRDDAHPAMADRRPRHDAAALAHLRGCGPDKDAIANALRKVLPAKAAYAVTRKKNIALQQFIYASRARSPTRMKATLIKRVGKALGPDYDVATHFTPSYNPWDQRLCLVPNGDLFAVDQERQGVGGHRPHRHVHAHRHPCCSRARNWRPTSSSLPPASTGHARRDGLRRRRRAGRLLAHLDVQGHVRTAACPTWRRRSGTSTRRGRCAPT
jgi:hypothetical protein